MSMERVLVYMIGGGTARNPFRFSEVFCRSALYRSNAFCRCFIVPPAPWLIQTDSSEGRKPEDVQWHHEPMDQRDGDHEDGHARQVHPHPSRSFSTRSSPLGMKGTTARGIAPITRIS